MVERAARAVRRDALQEEFFFAIGTNRNWSYLLPRALPPGRYVLDVKAFDGRATATSGSSAGKNRIVFEVVSRKARGTTAAARARRGARVQVMVVGKSGTLVDAAHLAGARDGRARVAGARAGSPPRLRWPRSRRRCVKRRRRLHVRDFGSCARRNARSSGQLFVDRDRRRAQQRPGRLGLQGRRLARDVGAGDPAGRRLRGGDRVLWFYCVLDAATRSCQRTLRVIRRKAGPAGSRCACACVRLRQRAPRSAGRRARGHARARVSAVTDAPGVASLTLSAGRPLQPRGDRARARCRPSRSRCKVTLMRAAC